MLLFTESTPSQLISDNASSTNEQDKMDKLTKKYWSDSSETEYSCETNRI
jgi:hypothetical protein